MMEVRDIVSYETAKKLKASGFLQEWDSGGHKYLYIANDRICRISNIGCYNFVDEPKDKFDIPNKNYPCVTLWQAQKWLREEHNIHIQIEMVTGKRWTYVLVDTAPQSDMYGDFYDRIPTRECYPVMDTYENALSAGIDTALNLIDNKTE